MTELELELARARAVTAQADAAASEATARTASINLAIAEINANAIIQKAKFESDAIIERARIAAAVRNGKILVLFKISILISGIASNIFTPPPPAPARQPAQRRTSLDVRRRTQIYYSNRPTFGTL